MGMSMHVIGFKPPDETWEKMKAVWDACTAADLAPPPAVEEFFDWKKPDGSGVKIDLRGSACCEEYEACCEEYEEGGKVGFEIDLSKLPADVKVIRFYNSW